MIELPKDKIENLRDAILEHCSIHFHKETEVGSVFYIVRNNKEDGKHWFEGKKGELKDLHVFVSNEHNHSYLDYEDGKDEDWYELTFFTKDQEEEIYNLDVMKGLEPILVGKYYGSDFYFKPELMTGTPTDETSPLGFIDALTCFENIRRAVVGVSINDKPIVND